MLNTVLREAVFLSANNDNLSRHSAAITATVFFTLVALLFGIFSAFNFIYILYHNNDGTHRHIEIVLFTVQVVGALLYLYGDNIMYILDQYGEELSCGKLCVTNCRITSVITLGVALLLYQLVPPCLHKIARILNYKEVAITAWYSASDMIITVVRIDVLYSAVSETPQTANFCNKPDLIVSLSFYLICITAGITFMAIYSTYSILNLMRNNSTKKHCYIVSVTFVLLVICLPPYILADNFQPLDCVFQCDYLASNSTLNAVNCNQTGNSGLRLGLALIVFVVVSFWLLLLFSCRKHIQGEGIV